MFGVFDLIDTLADDALATPDLDFAHDCRLMIELMIELMKEMVKVLGCFFCSSWIEVCNIVEGIGRVMALRMNI